MNIKEEDEKPVHSYNEHNILTPNNVAIAPVPVEERSQATRNVPSKREREATQAEAISFFYLCWQKTLDILFGVSGLLFLLLFLPFIAILIYLDSPGPIFYHQERVGYRGRKFLMHKLRSMRPDREQSGLLLWGTAGERVTRIGRFMRATHIDELPQVINILRGEMSLIGPRPERPEYVAELEKSNQLYHTRLSVKPGLTGWAQVNYGYGNSYRDDLIKLQYDLYYIKHRSYGLDMLIILKTVREVLRSRGDK